MLDELTQQDSRWARANAILADIGVSSHQLDAQNRGFSFRQDAPLDMRMDPTQGESAAELLSRLGANEIAKILRDYGEEPDAPRIAQALALNPPRTTFELAQRVTDAMSAVGRRKLGKRVHPATRSFQALRIAVNAEFDELDTFLQQAPARLLPGGRLGIITFHSLEDRRVKRAFRSYCQVARPPAGLPIVASELPQPRFCLPRTLARGIDADPQEITDNPRSRSARLRILERTLAP